MMMCHHSIDDGWVSADRQQIKKKHASMMGYEIENAQLLQSTAFAG
jgi:hypothetical protein